MPQVKKHILSILNITQSLGSTKRDTGNKIHEQLHGTQEYFKVINKYL
jgi:hypothetical protein